MDFDWENRGWTISLEEVLLWIMTQLKSCFKIYNEWFVSYKHAALHLCGLLWFYQLFGLSFWRHPFTAEDPLLSKLCNAKYLQLFWSRDKLIYILDSAEVSDICKYINLLKHIFTLCCICISCLLPTSGSWPSLKAAALKNISEEVTSANK